MSYGQAKVTPFRLEFYDGGLEKLQQKKTIPFRLKGKHRDLLKESLDEMVRAGVGSHDPEDCLHASPCSFAKRARSSKLRLCYASVDLNKYTKTIDYPLPIMEDIIERMKGKRYFTLLDGSCRSLSKFCEGLLIHS